MAFAFKRDLFLLAGEDLVDLLEGFFLGDGVLLRDPGGEGILVALTGLEFFEGELVELGAEGGLELSVSHGD